MCLLTWAGCAARCIPFRTTAPNLVTLRAVIPSKPPETQAIHESGVLESAAMKICAAVDASEAPSLSTFINGAMGGVGIADPIAELAGGMILKLGKPENCTTLGVTYHEDPCLIRLSPASKRLNGLPAPMAGEVCVDSWSGTSTVVGGNPWATVSANVTWVLDPAPDNGYDNIVHYYATGTFSIESGEPCAVMTPTDNQIAAYGTNHPYGFLEINYNTSPPSYKGYGVGAFELTNVCQSGSTTSMIPWFQTEPTITGWIPLDNNVMAGNANLGGATCTYRFTHD